MRCFLYLVLVPLLLGNAMFSAAVAVEGRVALNGSELVLILGDGRELRGEALVGAKLVMAGREGETEIRIDAVEEDARTVGGTLVLYRLSMAAAVGEQRKALCEPDAEGRPAAFAFPDGAGGFNFTCTSGAEGKCILFGYRPWETREGVPMRDLHSACIHMLRADYGGDDRPTTRNGTLINVYDRYGIQTPGLDATMTFEAAWSAEGAVCVARPRVPENITLSELAARYARLSGRLGPQACTEETARAMPQALLFNQSRQQAD